MKGKPLHEPPEYGRVAGAGVGASWNYYYKEDKETRKQRRKLSTVTLDDVQKAVEEATRKAKEEAKAEAEQNKAELFEAAKAAAREEAREELKSTFSALMPAMYKWTKENPNADTFPIPSFIGSNSVNTAIAPAPATGHGLVAPATVAHSSPSFGSGMPGGASTLADLNAITVITRRALINIFNLPFV